MPTEHYVLEVLAGTYFEYTTSNSSGALITDVGKRPNEYVNAWG